MASLPEGYRSRIAPQPGAPMPAARPEAFGAGVADAVGNLARTIGREKTEDERIDRRLEANQQWTDFQLGFATLREELATESRTGREQYDPGHADRLAKRFEEREKALLDGIADPEVRQRARVATATWGSAFRDGERDWQTLRGAEVAQEKFRDARDASANRTRRLEKPEDYTAELLIQLDAIDGLQASDKVKDALRTETEQVLAVSFLQGRIDQDPKLAKAMLDSGAFDEILDPKQVDALLGGAAVEIRRAEAAEEYAANQAKAMLREDLRLFREEVGQGLDRTDQIAGLRQRAEALGMPDVVAELDGTAADSVFARAYQGAPPVQLEQRMAVLRGKDRRSDAESRELRWIEQKLPAIATRFTEDPVGFYAREGGQAAPPPIDFNDPASVAARSRWAAAATQASGSPVPVLSKTEAAALASTYDSGRQGEESVLALLNRLPPAQAMAAARLVDPRDQTLPILATLPPDTRSVARQGRELLRANRQLLSDQLRDDLDLAEGWADTKQRFDRAMVAVPADQRDAIYETAKQIVAGDLDRTGGVLTVPVWQRALNLAMGATGTGVEQRGGFRTWGDRWFLLPAGRTQREFADEVVGAARRDPKPPVNPDGSPATLSRAYPVAVGPGIYEFRTAGERQLRRADGTVWRVKVGSR